MEEKVKKGGISVETAHIFPIIKKWLYSEKDIFLREIVSNAADAITKLKRLSSLGKYDDNNEKYAVRVILDKASRTITVSDNGIGMSEEELEKYICSIALSGALDFIQKYDDSSSNGIIGHFGLGFYSSFMISDTVEVVTRSYQSEDAIHWTCNELGEYETKQAVRGEHGTDVIMHISEEGSEYLDNVRIESILNKYCSFMSVDIYFDVVSDDGDKDDSGSSPINDTMPIWLKNSSECSQDEYNSFYKKVFNDLKDPLFYMHINADYPLNFKGVLYFPSRINEYESYEGQIKLFYNQVFVADDIKEIIPDYMLMLKGVLDCPELPLNVSRSYLQDSAYIKKVSAHIVKKMTDKICSLCNNEREQYEKIWGELKLFFEYASLRDRKFFDRVSSCFLMESTNGSYITISDYLSKCVETHPNTVYYATDKSVQSQYISMLEAEGVSIVLLPHQLDTQYATMYESINSEVKFKRIDSDIMELLRSENSETIQEEILTPIFKEVSKREGLDVKYESLKDGNIPAILTVSEESRRMSEMMKVYAGMGIELGGDITVEQTLVLNTNSKLIRKICELYGSDEEKARLVANEIYNLALLSQRALTAEEMSEFLAVNHKLLELI